ncbi:MAG: hypothetical protein M1835_007979 [Candelina submexicana]|nr:MAG: hypothetical protein M1835_007979 [Candelina submexicana]
MDSLKGIMGGGNKEQTGSAQHLTSSEQKSGGGFLGGIGNKLNAAAGGGPESEKNEDYLDKGERLPQAIEALDTLLLPCVDYVQEHFMGQGPQNNESAVEQAKDEQISDFIRGQYKSTTGKDFPVKDKPTTFG